METDSQRAKLIWRVHLSGSVKVQPSGVNTAFATPNVASW